MKKTKYILLPFLVSLFAVTGCNDDFVNTQPLGEVSEASVWTDAALAEAAVTNIYRGIGNGGMDEQMLASLTDETMFTHPGRSITTITESRSNSADPGWINNTYEWGNMFSYIRAANIAIEQLSEPQLQDAGLVDRLMGEAKFMRAYYYQQLLRYFGGFPIIDKSYGLSDDDFLVARDSYEDCVNFIVKDLDDAATLLAGKNLASGRTTELAALALKSRVLLYAASDLHDIPTASAKSSVISGFSNKELLGYTSGSQEARWQAAKAAAKAVLDKGTGAFLNNSEPVSAEQGKENYMNTSLSRNGGEEDLIFGRYFISAKREGGGRQGLFNGPNGYNNWAGNTPVSLLVDDYEMMDGSSFDWSNEEHAAKPYENRDPRFYASILYDGAQWKPRASANQPRDPLGQIQTGQYELPSGDTHFGLDTRNGPIEDWNGSYTGYYMRKFTEPADDFVDQNTWQEIPWPILRYTEAVFNYAEACIELGEDAEAKNWINKVRFRAGLPALTESGDALMERYRHEKRIEMVFEEQRYHDTRRWMIAPETLGRKANGINIVGTLKPGKTVDVYRYDPEIYDYSYEVINMDEGKENRQWADKMYFLPLNRSELNRNENLIQNPGFD
ncbi:RagB/SusD family nutrient uptake outer membrane protein [uncultured Arcticibacterium sp.]|uniref:RagB/SusD family nutrient uptake outer membrane protein n=1 Tax=uncultured Arcticibacterium sp. TaxID=2173042 RepID=UPI0030F7929F